MSGTKKDSHWIPLADLMTVLMVIFLFISISYMASVEKRQKDQQQILQDYEETKITLYNELKEAFKYDFARWHLKLDDDLSIKFINPYVLFSTGSSKIPEDFRNILTDFIPKYLNVVLKDKYKNKIAEIRIEGHTDTKPIGNSDDPYIDNMKLSQDRGREVLAFLRKQQCFASLQSTDKNRLQYWLTANGLSYGRTIDKDYKLSYQSKKPIDDNKSRRVEFRIITTSEEIIKKLLPQVKK